MSIFGPSNLPAGCRDSDLPGNSPQDMKLDAAFDRAEDSWCSDVAVRQQALCEQLDLGADYVDPDTLVRPADSAEKNQMELVNALASVDVDWLEKHPGPASLLADVLRKMENDWIEKTAMADFEGDGR